MDTTKREPEIEEGLCEKQEEAQKKRNPAKSDDDATGTTSREQTGKNMERRIKPCIWMKRRTGFLKEEVLMMNTKKRLMKEGEVHIMILNQARRPPITEKDHTMKMSRGRRQPRGY